jgi:hypothetical protein
VDHLLLVLKVLMVVIAPLVELQLQAAAVKKALLYLVPSVQGVALAVPKHLILQLAVLAVLVHKEVVTLMVLLVQQ